MSIKPLFTTMLASALSLCSSGAWAAEQDNTPTRLKVLALGHHRQVTWGKTTKDEVFQASSQSGQTVKEVVRKKGTLIEIKGKPFEYLPNAFYLDGVEDQNTGKASPLKLYLNSVGTEFIVPSQKLLDFKIQAGFNKATGEKTYSSWVKADKALASKDQFAVIIANPKELESWKKPGIRLFDISRESLPAGHMLFFNGTPYRVELQIPLKDTEEPVIIAPYSAKRLRPGTTSSGRTRVIAKLLSNDGKAKRQFYYNTVLIPKDGRSFMMTYFDPKKKVPIPAGVVQFTDKLPPLENAP